MRLTSVDPLGTVSTWLTTIAIAAVAAVVVLALAVLAVVVSRPRTLAIVALVSAVVLPVVAVYVAVSSGLPVAARHAAADGGALADLLFPVLDRYGVDTGPLGGLLAAWAERLLDQ